MTVIANFDGTLRAEKSRRVRCGGWHIAPNPDVPGLRKRFAWQPPSTCVAPGPPTTWPNTTPLWTPCVPSTNRDTGGTSLRGDSQLVIYQYTGKWKCRKPELQDLLEKLLGTHQHFARVDAEWVPREQNQIADEESRKAYEKAAS